MSDPDRPGFELHRLPDRGDGRGAAFFLDAETIAWLGPVAELHVVAIAPGKARGNHLHRERKEIVFVHYQGSVDVAWRDPGAAQAGSTRFTGSGGFVARIAPGTLHAFRNSGAGFVEVVSLSNGRFDPSETHYETLLA